LLNAQKLSLQSNTFLKFLFHINYFTSDLKETNNVIFNTTEYFNTPLQLRWKYWRWPYCYVKTDLICIPSARM